MNKELTPLEAFQLFCKELKIENSEFANAIIKALNDFERLKEGIVWRKENYEREIKTGVDPDGKPLSESNKLITLNLYNIMCALENYYEE